VSGAADAGFWPPGDMGDAVAILVAREGRLPVGASAAVSEAGGTAIVVGSGAEDGARALSGAARAFWTETGPGLRPAGLAVMLADVVRPVPLLVMPASPDGRDLAPRLAATLGRPLVAGAIDARCCRQATRDQGSPTDEPTGEASDDATDDGVTVHGTVARLDDRVLVPVEVAGPAVVTLFASPNTDDPGGPAPRVEPLRAPSGALDSTGAIGPDPETEAVLEPDVRTMDLADAARVVAGGAGLAAGADDREASARFELLGLVAAAVGASAGATRVATDAGWTGHERQIGTTGVTVSPDLYVAFGISGATQHVGGLGSPRHVVSINTDGGCPMTTMADLGLITDAYPLLVELARRFAVTANALATASGQVPADG
jgi:electron transfer flavoprotein alpha subunit